MKYKYHNERIPQDSRRELNEKILYLVDQDLAEQSGITHEDIYNAYTGDGGLHGLERSDFKNYHEFSEAKKEIENGQFFTPPALCQMIMEILAPSTIDTVADLTSGISTFANFMPVESNFYGCELDVKSYKVAKYLYPLANLERNDIRFYNPDMRFDYVVGNPPFNLKWNVDSQEIISQMYYCIRASELMKPLGIMTVVVPASFLADEYLDGAKISELQKRFSFIGQISVQKDAFKSLGVESYPTKILFFQKNLDNVDGTPYKTNASNCFTLTDMNDTGKIVEAFKSDVIEAAKAKIRDNKSHVRLSMASSSDDGFEYNVRKMMFHIKTNPKLVDKYAKCQEYIYKFHNQKQPEGMRYEEWVKVRITEAKVLAYFRRVIQSQNKKPSADVIRLVKRDGGLVYKGYSKKVRQTMSDGMKQLVSFSDMVSGQADCEGYGTYDRMIRRKQREYNRETIPFADMTEDPDVAKFLSDFTVYDSENEEYIRLNQTQKHDLNFVLQKHYNLLQWEQGGGKTLAGISVGEYRMQRQGARNVWVVSTAISIKNNWDLVLKNYGIRCRLVKSLSDLQSVCDGEFVLITLNALTKYRKQIKRHIKSKNQNVCLVFDESDEMTNPSSKRTKAVLDCFRRVKYKLAMTGTVTRNNISEIAPQIELLYNNSYNMISWAETLYRYEKSNGDSGSMNCVSNPYYGRPIPAYKPGYSLFAESHLPEKITVFGVGKKTQDVYNLDSLNRMLSYSVITRTFEEITGKEIRRIHQVPVLFSNSEREVYRKAIEEFHRIRERYFALTGNSRKDSMMALIQQITLLLRISAAPNTVDEYASNKTPVKIQKVCDMLESWNDEPIVIGVRHKVVVDAYADEIKRRFPDRKLFIVTGTTTTLAGRRKLKGELKSSGNGILLCTQQCLPSSVNFEFVNKVIIPELHYNNARMSQFYMRFVRFTSTDWKDIYFVTYSGSIESNQMQMVLAKEKLNLLMKGQDVDFGEIYERFGVDYDLMSLLMSRDENDDGSFVISWGQQKIV